MALNLKQPSMSSGELSPSLYARTDLEVYRTGLARCENYFIGFQGGVKRRAGFRYIGQCKTNNETVLIPFQFSTIQTYVLEVGPEYVRFIANGAYLTDGGLPVEVATPYIDGDLSRITYTQSADVLSLFHKGYPIAEIRRTGAAEFSYSVFSNQLGPFETINTDESKTVYASAQSGTVDLVSSFSLFNSNQEGKLLYLDQQTSGQVTTWIQRMEVVVGDKVYYAGNYYECTESQEVNNEIAQTGDTPPTHLEGEIWDGPGTVLPDDNRDAIIGVKWRYLHSGFGIVRVDTVIDDTNATGTVVKTLPESVIGGTQPALEWEFLDQSTETVYLLDTPSTPTSEFTSDFDVTLQELPNGETKSLAYISDWTINFLTNEVTLSNSPNDYFPDGSGGVNNADVLINQKSTIRETYKWAFEPWREDTGYPQCGTYYQQRLTMAATLNLPQTIWLSVTDSFNNFQSNRPLLADDTMRFDVNSLQVNEIYNLAPLNALLAFTAGGVWSLNQGSNDVITPENPPSVRIQSYDGASPIRPIITGSTGLYVQDGGQIVRDIGFDFSNDAFIGNDLTVRSTHLFENREVVSWAYAKNPDKVIWIVFSDGAMAAFTYLKEQGVWGWAPCNTDGLVKSVTVVREGRNEALYAVINRDGVNFTERMEDWKQSDRRDNFFVDSGLTYDGRNPDITMTITADVYEYPEECTVTASDDYFTSEMVGRSIIFEDGECKTIILIVNVVSDKVIEGSIRLVVPDEFQNIATSDWALAATTVSGLDHLEGKTVSIFADGSDYGDDVVEGGSVTLQSPAGVISVGLPYTSVLQTLDIELEQLPVTSKTKKNIINKVYAHVRDTMALEGGTEYGSLYVLESRNDENYNTPPNLKTDVVEINCDSKWGRGGRVILSQSRPVSTEILAIMPEVTISEM